MTRKTTIVAGALLLIAPVLYGTQAAHGLAGSVSAVYHEGVVTFTVRHARAVAVQAQVFDSETDSLLFDSGAVRGLQVGWPAAAVSSQGGFRYVVKAWDVDGRLITTQTAVSSGQSPITLIPFDTVPAGTVFHGGGSPIGLEGDVEVRASSGTPVVELSEGDVDTSMVRMFAGGSPTVVLDSSLGDSGDPWLLLSGSESFMGLLTYNTGDDSVVLSTDAVSSLEMLDEPGVAARRETDIWLLSSSDPTTLLARTINAPTDGYVVALASADFNVDHDTGSQTLADIGITDEILVLPLAQRLRASFPPALPNGFYSVTVSPTYTKQVSAGSHTFYLTIDANRADQWWVGSRNMELIFLPTSYGTVTKASGESQSGAPGGGNGTPSTIYSAEDPEREKTESIAATWRASSVNSP